MAKRIKSYLVNVFQEYRKINLSTHLWSSCSVDISTKCGIRHNIKVNPNPQNLIFKDTATRKEIQW